jgi:hypothetical protein
MYDAIVIGARCAGSPTAMLDAASFKPFPAEVYQLRAAVRGSPYDINQLIMANQGMIPREAFFNPKNLERIMASAQRG